MKRALAICMVTFAAASALAAPKKKAPPPKKEPAPAPAPDPTPPPPPPEPVQNKPWAEGVPVDVQAQATALYDEGNELFAQQAHAPALEKYKQALALWDHPKIRFNLAVTEIRLDRVLDAADDLEKALKYGDQPFTKDLYQQALDYQVLVKGRVGYIEVECNEPGGHVFFDGKPWFDAPGKKKMRVLAGEHAVSGEKPDFLASTRKVVVAGGATATETLKFVPLDSAVVLKYPYRRWIPWTMTGIGLAVGLAGAGTLVLGNNGISQFETDYATQCAKGCEPGLTDPAHRPLASERDSAELKQKVGVAMIGVGGAVAVTGVVLAILNRPTRVLPNLEVAPKPGGGVQASVGWRF
jgi:hypothetical protein